MSTEAETPAPETNENPAGEEGTWPKSDDNLKVEDIEHTDTPAPEEGTPEEEEAKIDATVETVDDLAQDETGNEVRFYPPGDLEVDEGVGSESQLMADEYLDTQNQPQDEEPIVKEEAYEVEQESPEPQSNDIDHQPETSHEEQKENEEVDQPESQEPEEKSQEEKPKRRKHHKKKGKEEATEEAPEIEKDEEETKVEEIVQESQSEQEAQPQEEVPEEEIKVEEDKEVADERDETTATKRQSYVERRLTREDVSFDSEQPSLRERRESKARELQLRTRKIERETRQKELEDEIERPRRKSERKRSSVAATTDRAPRSTYTDTTSKYTPTRSYSFKSSGDTGKDHGGSSWKSPKSSTKVPNYSVRDKKTDDYFSMTNYYPGKFSSAPRAESYKINPQKSSTMSYDDIDISSSSFRSTRKQGSYDALFSSKTPTSDYIKLLSSKVGASPITRDLYETNLDYLSLDKMAPIKSPYLSSRSSYSSYLPYSSYSYPKARNLYDPYNYYYSYNYYPYSRDVYTGYGSPSSLYTTSYTPLSSYYTMPATNYFYNRYYPMSYTY